MPDHILGGGTRKPSNTSLVSLTLCQLGLCVAHTAELVDCNDEFDEAVAAIDQEFLLLRHHVFAQDPQPEHVAKASLRLLFGSRGREKLRDCSSVIALEHENCRWTSTALAYGGSSMPICVFPKACKNYTSVSIFWYASFSLLSTWLPFIAMSAFGSPSSTSSSHTCA